MVSVMITIILKQGIPKVYNLSPEVNTKKIYPFTFCFFLKRFCVFPFADPGCFMNFRELIICPAMISLIAKQMTGGWVGERRTGIRSRMAGCAGYLFPKPKPTIGRWWRGREGPESGWAVA